MMQMNFKLIIFGFLFTLSLSSCVKDAGEKQNTNTVTAIESTGNPTLDALNAKIHDNPNDPILYAGRAEVYYKENAYKEAIQDMAFAMSIDSTNAGYHHLLADIFMDFRQSRQALKTMERAAALHPERIPTLLKLSEFQMLLKQNQLSMKSIDKILQLDKQNAEAYFMMGLNFRELGDIPRAINSFQTAVENEPDLIDGWIILGKLFAGQENKIAIRYFNNAVRLDSLNPDVLMAKAGYLHNEGDLDEALQVYDKIVRVSPQYSDAFYNMGLAKLEQEKVDEAYKDFDMTIKTDPLHIMGYYYRALTAEQLGNRKQAEDDYNHVLKFSPDFERALQGLERLAKG